MDLGDLVAPGAVIPLLKATNKRQALQKLSVVLAGLVGLSEWDIFTTLLARERLGATVIGNGVAVPHGTLPGLRKLCGLFARLEHPIPFDTMEEAPVDLIFVLLAPENEGAGHFSALADVVRRLRQSDFVQALRVTDQRGLYRLLSSKEERSVVGGR